MKVSTASFLVFWLTCGFFAWGTSLGYQRYQNRNLRSISCREDLAFSAAWGELFGPIGLGIALATSGFAEHGLQWTCRGERQEENAQQ